MANSPLSAKFVEAAKAPEKNRIEYPDSQVPGFRLRITEKGAKSWVLLYRVRGFSKLRRMTIGSYPEFSLSKARNEAYEAKLLAGQGIDPVEVRAARRAEIVDQEAQTVEAVYGRFLVQHAKTNTRAKTWKETERLFKHDVLPKWRHKPVSKVTKKDVVALLDKIAERGSPIMANRVLAALSKFFNWCMEKDLIVASPTLSVGMRIKEDSRDRVLTDTEIKQLWNKAIILGWPFGVFFQVLLLTAQRRNEVARMRWQDLDLDNGVWTLPKESTKADRAHIVPLAPQTLALIKSAKQLRKSPWVFTTTGKNPVSGFSKAKITLDSTAVIKNWRFHDLRRTAASNMAKLGVSRDIISKVLNHSSSTRNDVTAIYDRHGYDDEKREALKKWHDHLLAVISQ